MSIVSLSLVLLFLIKFYIIVYQVATALKILEHFVQHCKIKTFYWKLSVLKRFLASTLRTVQGMILILFSSFNEIYYLKKQRFDCYDDNIKMNKDLTDMMRYHN